MNTKKLFETAGGLKNSDVPNTVRGLASALARIHGDVSLALESRGIHLYMACPECSQVHEEPEHAGMLEVYREHGRPWNSDLGRPIDDPSELAKLWTRMRRGKGGTIQPIDLALYAMAVQFRIHPPVENTNGLIELHNGNKSGWVETRLERVASRALLARHRILNYDQSYPGQVMDKDCRLFFDNLLGRIILPTNCNRIIDTYLEENKDYLIYRAVENLKDRTSPEAKNIIHWDKLNRDHDLLSRFLAAHQLNIPVTIEFYLNRNRDKIITGLAECHEWRKIIIEEGFGGYKNFAAATGISNTEINQQIEHQLYRLSITV